MKFEAKLMRSSLLLFAGVLAFSGAHTSAQTQADSASAAQGPVVAARITQAIDESQLVALKGNVHPLARAEFDRGPVSNATPMTRMMLLLQRSPEQQAALRQFMDEQLSKESPNFHKWLTPEEFGKLYGPADADIQVVTNWLSSHGFAGMRVNRGKTIIEFSGNVGQVRSAFHTYIHKFVVNGDERQANIDDPQLPAALTPVVAGIVSLHNFPMKSMRHEIGRFTRTADGRIEPQFTGSGNPPPFFALGPADFAKIYNIPASLDGTGGNIAIVGFSSIDVNDAHSFRALFGLPVNDPIVVNNGPDPGFNGEEGEADLDTQWSGAVAPKATIHYVLSEGTVTSDPIVLSAEFVVDNNSDDVMSLSFGSCEAGLTAQQSATFNALWEQAAAQGITVTVSAGDGGAAGCDDFNAPTPATHGIAVSGIASTPFNIAVGGTDFDDVGTQISGGFWSATNSADGKKESALGYIHEVPWNDSCAATATPSNLTTCLGAAGNNIVAASGGPSTLYAKPSFQSGIIPNGIAATDNHRYLPDVSLFASDGKNSKSFYVVCEADAIQAGQPPSCASSGSFSFFGVGGTSASAPSFAGIMALIGQSEATATPPRSRRQGNANVVLYKIAQTPANSCNSTTQPLTPPNTCVFYDVTKGNNAVPCAGASPNCSSTTPGTNGVLVTVNGSTKTPAFSTTAGTGSIPSYDLATGLGTVNVTNLAAAWGNAAGAFKGTTTALKINGSTTPGTIAHGTAVTAAVTVAVVAPATGTPTGDFSILPANATANGGAASNTGTLASGTASISTVLLPGGNYSVTAHYAGDGTFGPSESVGVPVNVTKENSRLQMEIVTFDLAGNIISTNATNITFGSPYILRMDVLDHTANACTLKVTALGCAFDATGTITLTDNGAPLDGGSFKLNSQGHAEDQPINLGAGQHPLSASYSGDVSYNPSRPVTDTVTVTQAATATSLVASTATATTAQTVTLTATIMTQSVSTGPTGTVTFSTCGTPPCTAPLVPTAADPNTGTFAFATATLPTIFTTTGTKTITATYAGDANFTGSGPSTSVTVTVTSGGTFIVGGSAVTVMAGTSQISTITVTPSGGFTGMVNVTCPTAGLPAGVTCSPNPLAINVTTAAATTGQLTVAVAAPSTTLTASAVPAERTLYAAGLVPSSGGKGWWTLSVGTGLAAMLLLFLPGRKRYRAALGLGLVCVLTFTLGCGGGYGGGGGPVATVTKLTLTAPAKVASGPGDTFAFAVAVTGGTPTGQVQLFDGATALGAPVTVSGGSASITSNGLPVGTHSISAHYLGTTTTMASQSGTINATVTGTTNFVLSSTPASSNANPTASITIN
jgi:pro-kumamolisin-like protein/Big-like domain-containing protein